MGALVQPQVDPLLCARDPGEKRLDELVFIAHEREDRAVVILVRMDVEQPRPCTERRGQGIDGRPVAALAGALLPPR